MKAQLLQAYGDTPDFILADIPMPEAGPGQVLIRVAATSVNPIDLKIRKMKPAFAPPLPAVLGMDVAGTVEAVGAGVTNFKPGDDVFGCIDGLGKRPGTLAEYTLADAHTLALKPANLSMTEAAALPLVSLTAWEALFDRADLKPGQHILIHAGTGGVGHVAVQLAKAHGARVATTVSSQGKAELAATFGPDEIINYRKETIEQYVARLTKGQGFDVVFDTVGGTNLDASFAAATAGGTVVSINTRSTHDLSIMHAKGLNLAVVFLLLSMQSAPGLAHHGAVMARIAEYARTGKLTPLLATVFPLEKIADAHNFLDSGKAVGKVVVSIP